MSLREIKPSLRTVHNGSNNVAKAYVVVPANGELTVPEEVAVQLQRDGAFKDGPAPVLYEDDGEPEAKKPAAKTAKRTAKKG